MLSVHIVETETLQVDVWNVPCRVGIAENPFLVVLAACKSRSA
jgi:hypothetical protein